MVDIITAFFAILETGVLIGGLVFAYKQISEAKRVRNLQEFATLMEQWGQEEERKNRQIVMTKFPDDTSKLTDENKLIAASVATRLNRIGFMVNKKLIPEDDAVELVGAAAIRCWDKLKGYVYDMRGEYEKRGISSKYLSYFEWFANNVCMPRFVNKN